MREGRITIGFIAAKSAPDVRRRWSAWCRARGVDAACDVYVTTSCSCPVCSGDGTCLLLRLSEMHLHDRRGYALAPGFQEHAMKLMDRLDDSAVSSGRIDTVVNDGGILTGFFVDEEGSGEEEIFEKRLELWKTVKK